MVVNEPTLTTSKEARESANGGTQWLTPEEAARELQRTTRTVSRIDQRQLLFPVSDN